MIIDLPAISALDLANVPPALRDLHDCLQGNILKGHGRSFTRHLFLKFSDPDQARNWIVDIILPRIPSATEQMDQIRRFRDQEIPGGLFGNLFLTYSGYRFLGFEDDEIPAPPSVSRKGPTARNAFRDGMKHSHTQAILGDSSSGQWDKGFQGTIHAMVLLADDDAAFLGRELVAVVKTAGLAGIEVVQVESGRVLRNAAGQGIEHFGYVDGRSQPLYYLEDILEENRTGDGTCDPKSEIGKGGKFDPRATLDLVLVPEPDPKDGYGSFFVFRKLEQNVRGFKQLEKDLARQLNLEGEDAELVGAMAVGRFEDGTPVALRREAGMTSPVLNNFNYDDDPEGMKCPFHAHIRKVNPRGQAVTDPDLEPEKERDRRITRRGIPYGWREVEPKDNPTLEQMPTGGVGLLFMCFQADIASQFEFMQAKWANNENFPTTCTGLDPVIGQGAAEIPQSWPAEWGEPAKQRFSFNGFVTLKGGEYFFAPSLAFLKRL